MFPFSPLAWSATPFMFILSSKITNPTPYALSLYLFQMQQILPNTMIDLTT